MTQDAAPLIIKKYANRRLYNTATSSYIVTADIIKLVEQQVAFKVVDAKSGEDLTRNILNQVIFEQESKDKGFLLPLEFQKQLILMYSDAYKAMLPGYLANAMQTFADQRASMVKAYQSSLKKNNEAMLAFSQKMAEQNQAYFAQSLDMFRAFTGTDLSDETASQAPNETNQQQADDKTGDQREEELQAIRDQVTKLQQQLDEMAR